MAAGLLSTVLAKLRRDSDQPWLALLERGLRYGWELGSAKLYLRAADTVGRHARTLNSPRIRNLGRLDIGDHVLIRSILVPVEIGTGPNGVLRIGDGVRINYGVSMYADAAVTIGNRVRIGPYAMIVDTDFHDSYERSRRAPGRPIVIEDDVWIGAKASVLKGVTIGRGSIVGVGAVVTSSVEPFSVVMGVPAKAGKSLDAARFVKEDVV
jgi:maltose O-acetyltransferase